MGKILIPIIFVLTVSVFSSSSLAQEWWNTSWHFKFPVNISSTTAVENASVKINVNFSALLANIGAVGTFDPNSIRVIEKGFDHPHDWENETIANNKGNVSWIANGTTPANTNRTFWIYFDVIENGVKPKGKIITERPYWRSGYPVNMEVWSNQSTSPGIGYQWNRTWAQSLEIFWKWSSEAGFDNAYLYVNGLEVRKRSGYPGSSELASFLGNRIAGRFKSDDSIEKPSSDEYGVYGTAIDWIKFYPVTSYTTPPLTTFLGSVTQQSLKNFLELPLQGSFIDWRDSVLIRGNVTGAGYNLVTGATVNFTLINGIYNYVCIGVDEGNGKYNCTWDTTGKPLGNYSIMMNSSKQYYNPNSTIWVNRFTLRPGPPVITINLSKTTIEQLDRVQINATVEDQSGTGIAWVKVNITQPNGNLEQYDMTNIVSNLWTLNYTNTSQRGIYNITVYSSDNTGRVGSSNTTLKVYLKLAVSLKTQQDYYYQGESGRVEYSLQDGEEKFVKDASVTLWIRNPNGNMIWSESGVTNVNGTLEPLPTFVLASSDPIGNYTIFSNTSYFDSLADITLTRLNSYVFRVFEKMPVEMFFLSIEASDEVLLGTRMEAVVIVTDGVKNVDVDSARASLYNPLGEITAENISMTRVSTGVYTIGYNTIGWVQGTYKWVIRVTRAANTQTGYKFQRLIGGPFDVRDITVIDNTIPDLTISVKIENTGGAGQDAIIDWNLTRVDTNQMLDSGRDTKLIPPRTTIDHLVYPSTTYVGDVKINFLVYYGPGFAEKAGAYEIFKTVEEAVQPPTKPGVPPAEQVKKIEIVDYTKELEVERGFFGFLKINVKNTGNVDLTGVSIQILDINPDWIELPEKFNLNVNENKTFYIKFAVPINVKSDNYLGKIVVSAEDVQDEESFILRVFASRAELIYYQIQTLKDRLKEIENRTLQAEKELKDVERVKNFLDRARDKINSAERYLDNGMYDDAADMVRIARDYLDKAEYELQIAKPIEKPPYAVIVDAIKKGFVFILIALIVGIVVIIVAVIRSRKSEIKIKLPPPALRKVVAGQIMARRLEREKEKIEKIFPILEKEYKEGIISKEAYEELMEKNKKRLEEIERKLEEI